jgi:hypothetical protein
MKPSAHTRRVIIAFILAVGITLIQSDLAFDASRSSGKSRSFKASRSGKFSSVSLSGVTSATFTASSVSFSHPRTEGQGFLSRTDGFLSRPDGQRFFSRPFGSPFGGGRVFVVDGFNDQPIIVIQLQAAPAPTPNKSAEKRIWVPARWVDAGHGVEILEHGRWTVPQPPQR